MLTKYSIENFKSFSFKQEFELSNLTLIYGQNSSGKSSIIQSLLLLKQTLLGRDSDAGLVTSGRYVALADHKTLIHKHDNKLDIGLGIEFRIELPVKDYMNSLNQKQPFGIHDIRKLSLSYSYHEVDEDNVTYLNSMGFSASQKNSSQPIVNFSIYNSKNKKMPVRSGSKFLADNSNNGLFKYIKKKGDIGKDGTNQGNLYIACSEELKLSNNICLPIRSDSITSGEKINEQLGRVFNEVEYELNNINYLGPLRSYPKRFYSSRGGEKSLTERDFVNVFNDKNKGVINKVNYWFEKFEIPYVLSVENVGNNVTGKIISIQLKDIRNNTTVTPADVGFGIGQVLPIIIDAVVSKNSIICVEQPEIHLHPKLQAHLADLFIESVNDENNNQWIIETHSEALILRIQRRIRNGNISKSLAKVIYVQAGDNGSSIQNLPLDDTGKFLVHWPEGFFEERIHEQFGE